MQALSVALRQMKDHSRQRTAATRFDFEDQTSVNTTDTYTQLNIHSKRGPQRKQANGTVESFL